MSIVCDPCPYQYPGNTIAVVLTVLVTIAALSAAYRIGKHVGYWMRVREEKFARGIK